MDFVSSTLYLLNMGEILRIILLLMALIAGAIAIFFSFQLMKRYRLVFVNSYFYYLVFFYIFGSYSLAGSGVMEFLLIKMEVGEHVIRSAKLITILMGIPFFVLAQYMLLRSFLEFFSRRMIPGVTVGYFLLALAGFVFYGVFIIRLTRFNLGDYERLILLQRWSFTGFFIIIYGITGILAFVYSAGRMQKPQKRFIRIFAAGYLAFMAVVCAAFLLIPVHEAFGHIFLFMVLSWHLIPILFMGLYLAGEQPVSSGLVRDFEQQLSVFTEKYEISKREQEVIRLICKGLSNQQISDSLYISLQTVKDHIHHIYVKTGVRNRVQLTNMIRTE